MSAPPMRTPRIQVRWLSPTWSTTTSAGGTPSREANWRWNPIATLQRPTARWPASSSARVTMPTGFVKSMIHASERGALADAVGDLEHDRDGAESLAEAARTRRLLADAPAGQRDRLVREPRRLAADTDLDEHEIGAVERAVEIAGDEELAVEALAGQHPPGHAADDLATLGVDVVQDELGHVDAVALAREAGDELGRVGRAAADDRDLHPFTPVSVMPSTNAFWATKKRTITGQHDEQRRRHRQVPLHLVDAAELGEPDRRDPVVGVLAHVEERQEEVVPGVEDREQGDGRDRGLGKTQDDRGQDPELPAAVDPRRIEVLLGDREEELAQEKDRERVAEPVRQDQRPQGADEVQLRPHHVERHDRDLWRQHQRHEHDEEGSLATAPAQPGEGIGDGDARDEQAERREAGVDERVERPAPDRRAAEHLAVVAPLERVGPELRRQRLLARHQRREEDEDDREQEDDRGGDEQAVIGDRDEQPVAANRRRELPPDERRGLDRAASATLIEPRPGSGPSAASCAGSGASPRTRRGAAGSPSPTRSPC